MIIGVDPGERRTGVAVADLETRWARPLEVIDAQDTDPVARIAELVMELNTTVVVVGRPTTLSGDSGPAVEAQQDFVARLRAAVEADVEEFDERLTTVAAERRLREAGATAATRKAIKDAVAAQLMLQDYLDSRR
ncbi:MAG TPA: Holliday junction resolvase RuvX [Actinomycetota bacterium]|nr:Holliday junction resolvase RuvX [Actinomycetota bacterium]